MEAETPTEQPSRQQQHQEQDRDQPKPRQEPASTTAIVGQPEPIIDQATLQDRSKHTSVSSGPTDGPRKSNATRTNASTSRPDGINTPKSKSRLPDWITEHLTIRDLKILIRCSIAAWASFLFVVIDPVLHNFGQAAFLGMLSLFINPPAVILPFYILAGTTILLGMCLAWGWGSLAYLAAVSWRNDAEYFTTYNAIRQAAAGTPNPSFYVQREIFNGELLETDVTIILMVMCLIFVYFMARLQAAFPLLILTSIFGIIVIDIYLTTAPLVNNFNGLLPLVFVKPLAASVAIGIVLSLFLFPESCSHATLVTLGKSLKRIQQALRITQVSLQDIETDIPVGEVKKLKQKIIDDRTQAVQGFTFIGIEPSVGRWSGEDVKSLKPFFDDLYLHCAALLNFHITRQEFRTKVLQRPKTASTIVDDASFDSDRIKEHKKRQKAATTTTKPKVGEFQNLASMTVYEFLRPDPEIAKLGQRSLAAIEDVSHNLLEACNDALDSAFEIIDSVNTTRWFGCPKASAFDGLIAKHTESLDRLNREKEIFHKHAVNKMVDPLSQFFDDDGKLISIDEEKGTRLPGLLIAVNYKHRVLTYADCTATLLEKLVDLEMKKTKTRLWMPFAFRSLFPWALGNGQDEALKKPTKEEIKEKKAAEKSKAKELKESHRRRGGRERNGAARALTGVYHWLTNSEGAFAARVVIVSIALTVPCVVKASSAFAYNNRAIWALIMAQLTISQFMGDFVFSVAMRTAGTVVGGVFGLIVWYAGSGSGPGNPYGIMAVLAPIVTICIAIRIFAPLEWLMPVVMGAATMMLVVGYSWETNYLPGLIYQEPGYGVFWRRLLLVMVGFGVAILVQIFPRPPSATKNASKSLARSLSHYSSFYAQIMSTYLTTPPSSDPQQPPEGTKDRVVALYQELHDVTPKIKMVKYEPSSSHFTCANLTQIEESLAKILESMSMMAFVLPQLSDTYRRRLEAQTDFAKTDVIASIMAVLGVVEGTLKSGHALAEVLPVPLLGRLRKCARREEGVEVLSRDMMGEDEWSTFVVALMAVTGLYSRVDDLVMCVKDAVGEKHHIKGIKHDDLFPGSSATRTPDSASVVVGDNVV